MARDLVGVPATSGRQPNLAHAIADELCEMIAESRLPPGSFLPTEPELMARFSASRTAVREATKMLVARGLVTVARGKGVQVTQADGSPLATALGLLLRRQSGAVLELWEIRMILETEIAATSAVRATPDDLLAMEESIARMERGGLDVTGYVEANWDFHACLARSTHNSLLPLVLEPIALLLRGVWPAGGSVDDVSSLTAQGHRTILAAIRRRDPAAAREAMRQHLQSKIDEVQAATSAVPDRQLAPMIEHGRFSKRGFGPPSLPSGGTG